MCSCGSRDVQQQLKSYGGSITVGTPTMWTGRGDLQEQLKACGGRIAVGSPAVCSGRGYCKSRGVVARTPRQQQQHQREVVRGSRYGSYHEVRGNMFDHFARSRATAKPCVSDRVKT